MIAEEDCRSRSRFKGKTDTNEEKSSEDDGGKGEEAKKHGEQKKGPNEYELNRQRNIEDLKRRLHGLKEQYPITGGSDPKQAKKSASNKRKVLDEHVSWESQTTQGNKDKDKEYVSFVTVTRDKTLTRCFFSVASTASSFTRAASSTPTASSTRAAPSTPAGSDTTTYAPAKPPSGAEGTPPTADDVAPHTSPFEPQDAITLPIKASDAALVGNHDLPTSPPTSPNPKKIRLSVASPSPVSVDATESAQTTPSVTGTGGKTLVITTSALAQPNTPETAEACSNAHLDPTTPSISSSGISPESTEERADDDVIMGDVTSTNLLPWLASMLGYLRGVAEDAAWQDLVTAFVEFEECGPPIGVSSSSHC